MLATLAVLATLATPPADSLSGSWQIKGDVVGNPVEMVCTFRTTDSRTLTGNCGDAQAQPAVITGGIEGKNFRFEQESEYEGQPITIIFEGSIASPTELKGTITVMPFDVSGSFSATPFTAKS